MAARRFETASYRHIQPDISQGYKYKLVLESENLKYTAT